MEVVRPDDIGTPLKLVHSMAFFDIIMYGNRTVNLEPENVERREEGEGGQLPFKNFVL